ncbi:MAG TPA: o-succinylbenzoate synthase [Actinomycetota bacterium]|nr:o-succinylbenzoate synthase [Actinomycetota bacterium]
MSGGTAAEAAPLAAVELLRVRLPLVRPFRTSFGIQPEREAILVRSVGADGVEGWGECVADRRSYHDGEWNDLAWVALRDHLVPATLAGTPLVLSGSRMARAALEVSLLDLELRRSGTRLADHLGGMRDRVPCGVSLGIEDDVEALVELAVRFAGAGYRRIKLKIEPGRDVEVVRAVREALPDTPLTADANAAYTLEDAGALSPLDAFGLEYLEQPLAEDRLLGHAELQRMMRTPICLDETITSAVVAAEAIELGACRVINVKLGRVGGLGDALAIHREARQAGVPLWCGGMLETGIGRATNLALASLPGFTLPGDTSASDRYFERDVTEPFVVDADGTMAVPRGPGIGVDPIPDVLREVTVERTTIRPGG